MLENNNLPISQGKFLIKSILRSQQVFFVNLKRLVSQAYILSQLINYIKFYILL